MQVRTVGHARVAHVCDMLSLVDMIAHSDMHLAQMRVNGDVVIRVLDADAVAVGRRIAGPDDLAAVGGIDGRAFDIGQIDAEVELCLSVCGTPAVGRGNTLGCFAGPDKGAGGTGSGISLAPTMIIVSCASVIILSLIGVRARRSPSAL